MIIIPICFIFSWLVWYPYHNQLEIPKVGPFASGARPTPPWPNRAATYQAAGIYQVYTDVIYLYLSSYLHVFYRFYGFIITLSIYHRFRVSKYLFIITLSNVVHFFIFINFFIDLSKPFVSASKKWTLRWTSAEQPMTLSLPLVETLVPLFLPKRSPACAPCTPGGIWCGGMDWDGDLGVSIVMGVPPNGWFIWENSIKMDDLGVPPFQETSI